MKPLTNLKIVNIEPVNAHTHPPVPHEILPKHEFAMLIVAPKGSGKTNFICNMLLRHYKGYFHEIWICSPTVNNDEKWDVVKSTKHVLAENKPLEDILLHGKKKKKQEKLPRILFKDEKEVQNRSQEKPKFTGELDEDDFFSDMDEVVTRVHEQHEIIEKLRQQYDLGPKAKFVANRVLVVLDDQAGMFKGGNTQNPLVNFVIRHRHTSTSVIIVTQAYKAIPRTIRTQCNALILFDIPNLVELKSVYEENPEGLSEPEWLKVYELATSGNYDFMYINNKFPKGERIFHNFESMLRIDQS